MAGMMREVCALLNPEEWAPYASLLTIFSCLQKLNEVFRMGDAFQATFALKGMQSLEWKLDQLSDQPFLKDLGLEGISEESKRMLEIALTDVITTLKRRVGHILEEKQQRNPLLILLKSESTAREKLTEAWRQYSDDRKGTLSLNDNGLHETDIRLLGQWLGPLDSGCVYVYVYIYVCV